MNQRNNTCIGRGSEGELGRERKDRVDYNRNEVSFNPRVTARFKKLYN